MNNCNEIRTIYKRETGISAEPVLFDVWRMKGKWIGYLRVNETDEYIIEETGLTWIEIPDKDYITWLEEHAMKYFENLKHGKICRDHSG